MPEKYKVGDYVSLTTDSGTKLGKVKHTIENGWLCIRFKGEVGSLTKTREIHPGLKKITKEQYEGLMN